MKLTASLGEINLSATLWLPFVPADSGIANLGPQEEPETGAPVDRRAAGSQALRPGDDLLPGAPRRGLAGGGDQAPGRALCAWWVWQGALFGRIPVCRLP